MIDIYMLHEILVELLSWCVVKPPLFDGFRYRIPLHRPDPFPYNGYLGSFYYADGSIIFYQYVFGSDEDILIKFALADPNCFEHLIDKVDSIYSNPHKLTV